MDFSKSGFSAQIAAYLRNKDFQKAYNLSKEFVGKFPNEVISHYLLSESAFWFGRYEEAAMEGRRAYNKSVSDDDMLVSAIVAGSAYFELKQYAKGLEFLKHVESRKTSENLERLLFMFSMAVNDDKEAAEHLSELYKMNQKAAEDIALRYLT
jgi:tetratricopeptide (TPR) repeat protein